MKYSKDKVDDAVLALLWLTHYTDGPNTRAWKGHEWGALERLHERGLIGNPVGKAKSVVFSDDGVARARELFDRLFAQDS